MKKIFVTLLVFVITIMIYSNFSYARESKCGNLLPQLLIPSLDDCHPVCGNCLADIIVTP